MSNFSEVGIHAVMDLGNMMSNSQSYIDKINDMNKATANFALNATKNFTVASRGISDFEKFVDKVKTVASGILISDVIRGIVNGIDEATSEMMRAVSQFQTIEIQMDTLAARDYARQFGITIPEALKKTSGESEKLLRWVREIAVTTPFSVENLASVTALSNAYGFAIPEVKNLVLAVGDFTAGMGLSDEVLKRIIYNMGQMVAQGRPTGRELRDLSNSFVPIGEIQERFAKQLGVSKEAIIDMMRTGEISARQFVDEFIEMVDEDFTGAMDRMSRTFEAAFNNVKDLVQSMLGYEVFGPVAKEIAEGLQDAVSGFLTDENYQKASLAGETLLFIYKRLGETLIGELNPALKSLFELFSSGESLSNKLITSVMTVTAWMQTLGTSMSEGINFTSEFISGLYAKFGTSFADLTSRMHDWGQNLVLSFAKGMSSAIVAVLNVIASIGRTITRWLRSNSPPLLLPELDQWGTNAMMSYLEGWTRADFSVFEDIGDVISSMINSWAGRLSTEQINTNLITSTVALSKLIEQYRTLGVVSSEAISSLVSSTGIASNELSRYIQTSFNLMNMQKISDAVSKALDFSGVGTVNLFGTSISSFEEMANMASKFGPSLANYIRDYAQDASKLLLIDTQLSAAQKELNDVTARYNEILIGLQAQLNVITDRQEDITRIKAIDATLAKVILTADERERLELEKKKILIEREIRNTKTQQQTEESRLEELIQGYEDEKKALKDKVDEERRLIKQISDDNIASLQGQLEAIKQLINAQIKLNELYKKAKEGKGSGSGEGIDSEALTAALEEAFETALTDVTDAVDPAVFLEGLWKKIKDQVSAQAEEIKDIFSPVSEAFSSVINEWTGLFSSEEFKISWDGFTSRLDTGFGILKDFWNDNGEGILSGLGDLLGTIVTNLLITTDKTGKSVLEILADSFVAIAQTISNHGKDIENIFDKISEFMNDKAFPAFKEALTIIGTQVIPALINFAMTAIPPLLDFFGFLVTNWKTVLLVALAFQMMGGITSAGKGILGSGAKGLGFVLGGITLLKTLGIGGGVAGATGVATNLGIEEMLAAWGIGSGAKAVGTGAKTGLGGVTGLLGKVLPWLTALQMMMGLKGSEPTDDWKSDYEDKYGVEMGTMTSDEVAEKQRAKLNTWIETQFGENSAFQISMRTNLENVFGKEGIFVRLFNNLFGEESFVSDIGSWVSYTFGEDSVFSTSIKGAWNSIFGEDGAFKTSFDFLFGSEGILTKKAILDWIDRYFGEESDFQIVISDLWNTVFGEEGVLVTSFNFLFGSEGFIESDPVKTWLIRVFGEESIFYTTMNKLWNAIFGEEGLLVSIYNILFEPETTFFKSSLTESAGESIVNGVSQGIEKKRPSLLTQVRNLAQEILDAFNINLEINSPAKKFIPSGMAIPEGIAVGILQGLPMVTSSMNRLMSATLPSQSITNDNRVYIDMKPSYSNTQSPASIYHDVTAAIATSRL